MVMKSQEKVGKCKKMLQDPNDALDFRMLTNISYLTTMAGRIVVWQPSASTMEGQVNTPPLCDGGKGI